MQKKKHITPPATEAHTRPSGRRCSPTSPQLTPSVRHISVFSGEPSLLPHRNSPPQTENPLPCPPPPHSPHRHRERKNKIPPAPDRAGAARSPPPLPTSRACDAASPATVMVGLLRSGNLASRVFDRQCFSPRPGATVRTPCSRSSSRPSVSTDSCSRPASNSVRTRPARLPLGV